MSSDAAKLAQPFLMDLPVAGLYPLDMKTVNDYLVRWNHKLGPCNRPQCRQEGWSLILNGDCVAVAVSAPIVSPQVAGYRRTDVLELARLCAPPENRWSNRVMLRLWREVCAPLYMTWTPQAVVSYSHNTYHKGELYRNDGWTKLSDKAGSNGGGTWSTKRVDGDPIKGSKTLWIWRYDEQ